MLPACEAAFVHAEHCCKLSLRETLSSSVSDELLSEDSWLREGAIPEPSDDRRPVPNGGFMAPLPRLIGRQLDCEGLRYFPLNEAAV